MYIIFSEKALFDRKYNEKYLGVLWKRA